MPQWIGIIVTILGMSYAGYNQFVVPNKNQQQVQQVIQETIVQNRPIAYCQIQIAYDPTYNKHYFQHLDGSWKDYPPTP